jgi:transcriptional regulator with XRE-family HTH domain
MEYQAETATTTAVVMRVKHLRKAARLSGAELASGMARLGFRWNQSTVAKLEAGRRRSVSVDELLALAEVLNVPITALLVDERAERTRPTGGREYMPADVLLWLTADRALPGTPDYDRMLIPQNIVQDSGPWAVAARPARYARQQQKAVDAALGARERLRLTIEKNYAPEIKRSEQFYADRLRDLATALDVMRAAEMVPMPVDARLQHDAQQRGISLSVEPSPGQED